ncbi:TPA: DUF6568 family protein [Streptococcus suis]
MMKKIVEMFIYNKRLLVLCILVLVGITFYFVNKANTEAENLAMYDEHVSILTPLTYDELRNMIENGDNFYVFVGTKSCPDCPKFVKELHTGYLNQQYRIGKLYYLDSSLSEEVEEYLDDYVSSKTLELFELPFLAHFDQGTIHQLENAKNSYWEDISSFFVIESTW